MPFDCEMRDRRRRIGRKCGADYMRWLQSTPTVCGFVETAMKYHGFHTKASERARNTDISRLGRQKAGNKRKSAFQAWLSPKRIFTILFLCRKSRRCLLDIRFLRSIYERRDYLRLRKAAPARPQHYELPFLQHSTMPKPPLDSDTPLPPRFHLRSSTIGNSAWVELGTMYSRHICRRFWRHKGASTQI